MKQVNELLPATMPMSFQQLLQWSADVDRLRPDVGREQLQFLFDCFKTGEIEFDRYKGIQNIFSGLDQLECVNGKWQKSEAWPG